MTRPTTAALLTVATAFALTGCESVQLPEGYAWNVTTQEQNDIKRPRGAYRWGVDRSYIDDARGDAAAYDFAAALPQPYGAPGATPLAGSDYPAPVLNDLPPAVRPLDASATEPVFAAGGAPRTPTAAPTPLTQGSFRAPVAEVRILTSPDSPDSATPQPAVVTAPTGPRTHTVQKGDNYWDLAKRYYGSGVRFQDIQKANPGKDPKKLQIGDTLVIPE